MRKNAEGTTAMPMAVHATEARGTLDREMRAEMRARMGMHANNNVTSH